MRFSFQKAPIVLRIKPYGEYQVCRIEVGKRTGMGRCHSIVISTLVIHLSGVWLQ